MKPLTRIASGSAVVIVALTLAGAARAQSSGSAWYAPGSTYFGFNVGKSDYSLSSGAAAFLNDSKHTSYNIYGGGYFNNYMGLELGYTDFGRINRAGGTTKAEGFNLSLVGKVPLGSSVNLLGKLGTTYGHSNVSADPASGIASGSENGFGLSYGIGAEYAFAPSWSAVLQWDEHKLKFSGTGRDRVSSTTVGLRYRF
ncbi:Opacity protein [Polaromonas sp. OV174]|uniref:outer membrane beta-barrel protein n=1 Tax=Polaromonas sp. OV174 TaxID=1855300 RepID=UPI0008E57447|nr:outer membrane beta-barrel protein [Polaromonas sp. OV174]SFB95548.1 Opacity protein [Polaromonas sp. OV174]